MSCRIDIPIIDASRVFLWESVLICAEQLQMTQVSKVACYALGCAHALSDTRKIYLCAKHHLGNHWVSAELERLIFRKKGLTRGDRLARIAYKHGYPLCAPDAVKLPTQALSPAAVQGLLCHCCL